MLEVLDFLQLYIIGLQTSLIELRQSRFHSSDSSLDGWVRLLVLIYLMVNFQDQMLKRPISTAMPLPPRKRTRGSDCVSDMVVWSFLFVGPQVSLSFVLFSFLYLAIFQGQTLKHVTSTAMFLHKRPLWSHGFSVLSE